MNENEKNITSIQAKKAKIRERYKGVVLAPGGISHSGPGENRQFWPDENSQS